MKNAKGTKAAPTQTTTSNWLGGLSFNGHNGTTFTTDATGVGHSGIIGISEGNFTAGSSPAALGFFTTGVGTTTSVQRMIIAANGNVGIGTAVPGKLLYVRGDQSGGIAQIDRVNSGTSVAQGTLLLKATSTGNMADGHGTALAFLIEDNAAVENTTAEIQSARSGADNSGNLTFFTNNAGSFGERMRITPSGNVGIGSTVPVSKLDVNGTITATGFSGPLTSSVVGHGAGTSGAPSISFSGDTDTGFYNASSNNTISVTTGNSNIFNFSSAGLVSSTTGGGLVTTGNGTTGAPTFSFAGDPDTGWWRPAADTMAASTAGVERMRIDSNGNVGIGTSPSAGALVITRPTGTIPTINIATPGTAGTDMESMNFITKGDGSINLNNAATKGWHLYARGDAYAIAGQPNDLGFVFYNGTTGTQVLHLDSATGNVGIGTTSPASKLEVVDTSTATSGTVVNANLSMTINAGAASSATVYGNSTTVTPSGAQNYTGSIIGSASSVNHNGSGTATGIYGLDGVAYTTSGPVTTAVGIQGHANNNNTATVANATGGNFYAYNASTGSITAATGVLGSIYNMSTGTITNAYGLRTVFPTNAGTITNGYGVYIGNTLGTNDYGVFQVDATDENYFAGNVGIGTATPSYTLHAYNATTHAEIRATTAAADASHVPAFSLSNPSTTWSMALDDGNGLKFRENTSGYATRLYLQNGGNVGIGTTAPSYKFSVYGAAAEYPSISLHSNAGGVNNQITQDVTGLQLRSNAVGAMMQFNNSTGYVGVGTTMPTYNFHVQSTVDPAAIAVEGIGIVGPNFIGLRSKGTLGAQTGVIANDNLAVLQGRGYTSAGSYQTVPTTFMSLRAAETFTATAQGTYMAFNTASIGTNISAERVRIDSNGSVGIGTTSPTGKLTVSGDNEAVKLEIVNRSNSSAVASPRLQIRHYANSGASYGGTIELMSATGTEAAPGVLADYTTLGTIEGLSYDGSSFIDATKIVSYSKGASSGTNTGAFITFFTTTQGTHNLAVERMRIDHNGNVGIGTQNPAYKLDVRGGQVAGAGAYVNSSDARLKKDIEPIKYGLNEVLKLRPVGFNWKDQSEEWAKKHQLGVIAQETELIIPEVVTSDDSPEQMRSVAYGAFTPVLIKATQELYGICKMSEEQLASIQVQIDEHGRRLASLEEANSAKDREIQELKAKAAKHEQDMAIMKAYLCAKDPNAPVCK